VYNEEQCIDMTVPSENVPTTPRREIPSNLRAIDLFSQYREKENFQRPKKQIRLTHPTYNISIQHQMGNFLSSHLVTVDAKPSDLLVDFICDALQELQLNKSQYTPILDVQFSRALQFKSTLNQQDISKYFLTKRNAKFDNSVYSIDVDSNRCTLKTIRAVFHHIQVSIVKEATSIEVRKLIEGIVFACFLI
jgi:hypothetical protein